MPTGTGKSWVNAGIIEFVTAYPNQRVLCVTHVKELVGGNCRKARVILPNMDVGIVSAGLKLKEYGHQVTFAGIGSIYRKPELLGKIDIVVVDECHLVGDNSESMYGKTFKKLLNVNPKTRIVGLSATPYRAKNGLLTNGPIFTHICYDITGLHEYNKLVKEGFIAPLISKRTNEQLDLSSVRKRGGEFVPSQLQEAVDQCGVTLKAVEEMLTRGEDRNHWIVFGAGIDHCKHIEEAFNACGCRNFAAVHSKMSVGARDDLVRAFEAGELRGLVNNGILTTGFDYPPVDLIGMLRPTEIPGLHVQMNGRGSRPSLETGKENCLVLDYAGNTRRLGPVNDVSISSTNRNNADQGQRTAPVKACPQCDTYVSSLALNCDQCGYVFPRQVAIMPTADTTNIVADGSIQTKEYEVDEVRYNIHNKKGRQPSLRVTYLCGFKMFREWICLEHAGYAGNYARKWWRERTEIEPPAKITKAVEASSQLKKPSKIIVWTNKKHPEILRSVFSLKD